MSLPINQIICGDCIEVIKTFPDESIDLVVTSPPYNVSKDYGKYKDNRDYESYLDWLDVVWDECYRILRTGGRICINLNNTGRNPVYPTACDVVVRIRKKWFLMGFIVWDKQTCLSNTAWGSWLRPSAPSLRGRQEYIIVAGKGGKFFKKQNVVVDKNWDKKDFLKYTLEIWSFSPETRKQYKNPCPFPEELPKRCIKLFTYLNDIILDPFVGSGTTCVVAQKLGRRWIGIDISSEYCNIARQRLSETL